VIEGPGPHPAVPWIHAWVDLPEPLLAAGLSFWTAATGWPSRGPWPNHPEFHSIEPADGGAYLHVQRIDGAPRVHLDLVLAAGVLVDDERARHAELGAVTGDRHPWWQVMISPGGLAYCLVVERRRARPGPVTWPDGHRSRVAQVCIDVPAARFDTERDFWREATGWPHETAGFPDFARLAPPATSPMAFLLQRLGPDEDGPVRMHLDLTTDDRAAEVERVRAVGAELVDGTGPWAVLRDPAGLPFCVTPRSPG
jgi:Glyoxalase-like domain